MGVARIFQRGGHTDSYRGYSSDCHLNIVSCLLTRRLTKGGSRAPQDPPWLRLCNGLAERLVRTFKQALRAMFQSSKPVKEKLAKFLIAYRKTPHSTTGESPAQLLLGRPLRTRLDLVKPNLNRKMVNQQHQQGIKAANEKGRQRRQLAVGDAVMSRDYRGDLKWRSGLIVKKTGPLMYEVQVAPGIVWRRHIDQLRPTAVEPTDAQGVAPETVEASEGLIILHGGDVMVSLWRLPNMEYGICNRMRAYICVRISVIKRASSGPPCCFWCGPISLIDT